jgi:hypothetical protein
VCRFNLESDLPTDAFTSIVMGESSYVEQRIAYKKMKRVEKKGPSLEQWKRLARRLRISSEGSKEAVMSRIDKLMTKLEKRDMEDSSDIDFG